MLNQIGISQSVREGDGEFTRALVVCNGLADAVEKVEVGGIALGRPSVPVQLQIGLASGRSPTRDYGRGLR